MPSAKRSAEQMDITNKTEQGAAVADGCGKGTRLDADARHRAHPGAGSHRDVGASADTLAISAAGPESITRKPSSVGKESMVLIDIKPVLTGLDDFMHSWKAKVHIPWLHLFFSPRVPCSSCSSAAAAVSLLLPLWLLLFLTLRQLLLLLPLCPLCR